MATTPFLVERVLNIPVDLTAETKWAFLLTALSLPVVMVSASFRGVLEAAQRFDLVNAVKIPSSSANYLIPLLSLFVWKSLVGIVVMLLATRIVTLGIWIVLSFRQFPVLRCRPVLVRDTLRPLLAFGGWATVSSMIGSILENLDRFAIGAMLSVQAVGYYTAPYEAIGRLGILPASLITALFPAFSILKGELAEEKIRDIFAGAVKYVLMVTGTLVVPLVLLARTVLRLWLGADMAAHSTLVFQLMGASFLFLSFSYLAFGLLQGIGRTDLPAKIHFLLLVVYIPLLWGGIHFGGIDGAALAWFLHLGLQAGLQFRAVRRLGYADFRTFRRIGADRILAALALFSILAGLLGLLIPALWAVTAGAAVYLPFVWLWVLSREERQWLRSQRQKIFSGRRSESA
jgi:O-antigen/teichoic acid export membrane protein